MELALEFGCSVESLRKTLSERELWQWARYRARYQFPSRRMELYLAQLTAWVVRLGSNNKTASIQDFLIEMEDPIEKQRQQRERERNAEVIDLDELRSAFGFSPRKRKD